MLPGLVWAQVVLVTGGSGYIAQYCIDELLKSGYEVRTTVRDQKSLDYLRSKYSSSVDLVITDLRRDDNWEQAFKGVDMLMHISSPVPSGSSTVQQLYEPAVEGTLRVLKLAEQFKLSKVVLTSSISAASYNITGAEITSREFSKFSNLRPNEYYAYSKTTAEQAAWKFLHAENRSFSMTVLAPSVVFGPKLQRVNASLLPIEYLLDPKHLLLPNLIINFIDVRDLAKLHVQALAKKESKRYIVNTNSMRLIDINNLLVSSGFTSNKYTVPDFFIRFASMFSKQLRLFVVPMLGKKLPINTDALHEDFRVEPIDPSTSILDTARSLHPRN